MLTTALAIDKGSRTDEATAPIKQLLRYLLIGAAGGQTTPGRVKS
jgi:hypothetical protein